MTATIEDAFDTLTEKQRETVELLGQGRTSKEIASMLGISESAAVQRIETLRAKCGGILRKDLARAWREYCEDRGTEQACKGLTGKSFQVPPATNWPDYAGQDDSGDLLQLADAMPFETQAPWASSDEPEVVPEVLDGADAVLKRTFLAVGLALGLLVAMLVLLSVANELGELI